MNYIFKKLFAEWLRTVFFLVDFPPQVFPSVAGEDEDDVKSIRSHRMKMETSRNSLEESMEECQVEEASVSKVRSVISVPVYMSDEMLHNDT